MKISALIFSLILYGTLFGGTPVIEYVQQYENKKTQTIEIPSTFAKSEIDMSAVATFLKDKRIYRVDLVYTQFKQSPSFNQKALNERRKKELLHEVPDIAVDAPNWKWVEQTGAKTAETAKEYFHGFVVYYTDEFDYSELSEFLENFQHDFESREINNEQGGTLEAKSGSMVKVPGGAVVDKNGKVVEGNYTLKYREYRNPAEIALSGIPMGYTEKNDSYQFSSVGMYELRAEKDGEELSLQKPITVDFKCTDSKDGVSFYKMEDETGEWEKVKEITPSEKPKALEKAVVEDVAPIQPFGGVVSMTSDSWDWGLDAAGNNIVASFSKETWAKIQDTLKNSSISDKFLEYEDRTRKLKLPIEHREAFLNILDDELHWLTPGLNVGWNAMERNGRAGTLLGMGSTDPGHSYPNLVRGLNSKEFGVYNCDQIYRIGKPLTMQPSYKDTETGKEIKGLYVACLMDLQYNGSFSFAPSHITCNTEGRNALLVFTSDKKIYAIQPEDFELALAQSQTTPTFNMVDMSEEFKSPDDLKAYLSL